MTRPQTLAALATLLLMPMVGCDRSSEAANPPPPAAGPAGAAATTPTTAPPLATAVVGQPAPDFTLSDTEGKTVRLSDHKGKLVVLEWWNPGCPFVKFAHGEGPLRSMAAEQTAQGVVWFAINSGAAGKQGAGADASREGAKGFGMTHPVLLDEAGTVGRAYEARKTPHVYLIDDQGVLVYRGAIDNAPIGEVDGGGAYVNYLAAALADVRAGKPVATPQTDAYGCSVKYAS